MAAKSLFDCLQSFDKKNLKQTDTRVTTTTGDQIIEKRDSYGRVTTERIPEQTYGFVASLVEDLQVGEILEGLILGKILRYLNGRDRMVVRFTTTCAISAYHH